MTEEETEARIEEILQEVEGNDKISSAKETNEDKSVHYIGKLDKSIYDCITKDISTDEVIITDERIQHIKKRHPGVFETIEPLLKDAIISPDYILENAKNTGLILKAFEQAGELVQVVLKVQTSVEPRGFKNSILSAWTISEARWKSYLRNKKILYTRK